MAQTASPSSTAPSSDPSAGAFLYPPPAGAVGSNSPTYNAVDAVTVQWDSSIQNTSATTLQYWVLWSGPGNSWTAPWSTTVSHTGTNTLNFSTTDIGQGSRPYYYGYFVITYNAAVGGNVQPVSFNSTHFQVTYNDDATPQSYTYSPTSTLPTSTSTATPSKGSTSPANATTTSSSTDLSAIGSATPSSGLAPGSIAGIVIAALAFLALIAGFAFWLLRRRKQKRERLNSEAEDLSRRFDQRIARAGTNIGKADTSGIHEAPTTSMHNDMSELPTPMGELSAARSTQGTVKYK